MEQKLRQTGVEVIGDVPWGTHICLFYRAKRGLFEILVPYLKAGLENNESCILVTSSLQTIKETRVSLTKAIMGMDAYIRKGQIEILDSATWYAKQGKFVPDTVFQGWVEKEKLALERGFDGLRIAGDAFLVDGSEWKAFSDYEATVDNLIADRRMLAICSYFLKKSSTSEVVDMVSKHRFVLVQQGGEWIAVENAKRRQAEERLRLVEENFRNSIENSPLGICIVTNEGELLYANQAILDTYGYDSIEELKTTPRKKRYTPESYAKHLQRVESRRRGEPVNNYEISIIRKNNEVRHLAVSRKEVIWNRETQFQTIYQDMTERKQAEEALKQSETKYRTLMGRLLEGVYQSNLDGSYVTINEAGARIFGFDAPEQVIGKYRTIDLFYDLSDRAKIIEELRRTGYFVGEVRAKRRDGTVIWLEVNNNTTLDEKGNIVGYEGMFSDITELKQAENKGREVAILKELDKMRGDLLARVSHELRTPLATIKGYSTMLLDYDDKFSINEKRQYLGSIDKACDRLTNLVDSLLDMSRLEAGLLKIEKTPTDVSKLAQEAVDEGQLRDPKHRMVADLKPNLPKIRVDAKRIRQVIQAVS